MPTYSALLLTFPSQEEAATIVSALLEKQLIACANVIPSVQSYFWWGGKVQKESETLVIVKTKIEKFAAIVAFVTERHSYTVPEVISLPIQEGSPAYLSWLQETVPD